MPKRCATCGAGYSSIQVRTRLYATEAINNRKYAEDISAVRDPEEADPQPPARALPNSRLQLTLPACSFPSNAVQFCVACRAAEALLRQAPNSMHPVLIVPGWTNSGPEHWQTLWERELPQARRVEQRDWDLPEREAWVAALDAAIRASSDPPILVAHSLGCVMVAHWAVTRASSVQGALLVAPADVERTDAPEAIRGFAPIPKTPLPFPSILVASSNDPYTTPARSFALASAWGSECVFIGEAGHINSASGLGSWPDGRRLLAGFGA